MFRSLEQLALPAETRAMHQHRDRLVRQLEQARRAGHRDEARVKALVAELNALLDSAG